MDYYSFNRPRRDGWLSRPCWLTTLECVTSIHLFTGENEMIIFTATQIKDYWRSQAFKGTIKVLISEIYTDWIVKCFTSPPTQYRSYGRQFLQIKRPNQQYQSTEGNATKDKSNNENNKIHTKNDMHKISTSPLVYTNMGWLGDGSHWGHVRQAWTAVELPLWYPLVNVQNSNIVFMDNK